MRKDRSTVILKTLVDKMFEMAGHTLKYEDVVGRTDNWFQEYTMTDVQNKEWREWGLKYLTKDKKYKLYKAKLEMAWLDLFIGLKIVD
jgi:hypothetical protein